LLLKPGFLLVKPDFLSLKSGSTTVRFPVSHPGAGAAPRSRLAAATSGRLDESEKNEERMGTKKFSGIIQSMITTCIF
jgi:hypothetical protein